MPIPVQLYPYQVEIGRAVIDSLRRGEGHTFTVEIARQGGKNELSAQLELFLLVLFCGKGGNIVKASPTFAPQTTNSILRLQERLDQAGLGSFWRAEGPNVVRLGKARALFFSANGASHVVGATAHHLLEIDEAQDVDKAKYHKEFRPMASSTNATTVLYGTTWDDATLLEEAKQMNLEMERRDGVKRHFRVDWQEVARHNPDYLRYVERERDLLGEDHPTFRTQYALLPVRGNGGFFSPQQRAQLQGTHQRRHAPETGKRYVAGVDLAGAAESTEEGRGRDSTVVTIGEMDFSAVSPTGEPRVLVVEHYAWTGTPHPDLYARLVDVLRSVWRCSRVVVDATGVGEGVSGFLAHALGSVVTPFKFTAQSKSSLAFQTLAMVNSGRLKMYARDGSAEYEEFWTQMERAVGVYRANRTMSMYVDPSRGHDDYLMSLSLLTEAGQHTPRIARSREAALSMFA